MRGPIYKWSGWDCEHQYIMLFFEQSYNGYNEWTLVLYFCKKKVRNTTYDWKVLLIIIPIAITSCAHSYSYFSLYFSPLRFFDTHSYAWSTTIGPKIVIIRFLRMNQRMCSDPIFSNFSAVFLEIEIRISRVDDFPDFWIYGKTGNRFFFGKSFIFHPKT